MKRRCLHTLLIFSLLINTLTGSMMAVAMPLQTDTAGSPEASAAVSERPCHGSRQGDLAEAERTAQSGTMPCCSDQPDSKDCGGCACALINLPAATSLSTATPVNALAGAIFANLPPILASQHWLPPLRPPIA